MVSALDSGASVPDSRPVGGHCVVFFGKTLALLTLQIYNLIYFGNRIIICFFG